MSCYEEAFVCIIIQEMVFLVLVPMCVTSVVPVSCQWEAGKLKFFLNLLNVSDYNNNLLPSHISISKYLDRTLHSHLQWP